MSNIWWNSEGGDDVGNLDWQLSQMNTEDVTVDKNITTSTELSRAEVMQQTSNAQEWELENT